MLKKQGFTLVELVIFILILSIVAAAMLAATAMTLKFSPVSHSQTLASTTASGCMEYLLGQRRLNGFNFNSQICPGGSNYTTVPAFCNAITPTGYTTSITISCATVPGFIGTQAFKLVTVSTTGPVSVVSNVSALIAGY